MTVAATITAVKIHDGDPAVLAALCEQRGAAALAYCEEVASPGEALAAAADAFASFRAAIVAPQELKGRQAEALLRNMIRRSAMARSINALAAEPPSEDCADPETELLGYVNDALSPEQRERVAAHVAQCWSCATALQRLQAGERAFTQATRSSLSPGLSAVLLEAMVTAAPIRVQGEDAESVLAEGLRLLGVHGDGDGAAEPAAPPAATASDEPPPADATPPPAVERVRVSDPEDFDDEPQGVLTRGYPRRDPVRAADAAAGAEAERGDLRSRMASAAGRFSGRLPSRERRRGDTPLRHTRSAALLRGAGKLLVVVALAGSGGALLGLGLAELAGGDATSTPALTQTETSTSGAPARDRTSTATTPRTTTTSAETTTTPASTSTGGG